MEQDLSRYISHEGLNEAAAHRTIEEMVSKFERTNPKRETAQIVGDPLSKEGCRVVIMSNNFSNTPAPGSGWPTRGGGDGGRSPVKRMRFELGLA